MKWHSGRQAGGNSALEKLLGELELAVMEIAWQSEAVTVRDVLEQLTAQRPLAYTTVMTIMNRLVDKQLLTRTLADRTGVYRAAQTRDQYLAHQAGALVRSLLDDFGDIAVVQMLEALEPADSEPVRALEAFVRARKAESGHAGE
jgi:predicted transcriptional regulator